MKHHIWVAIMLVLCIFTFFLLWFPIGAAYGLFLTVFAATQLNFWESLGMFIACLFAGPFAHYIVMEFAE